MNNWIFTVTNHQTEAGPLNGREIYLRRMDDQFWGLGTTTPNVSYLEPGDNVVFYVGRPEMAFAGTAQLSSPMFELDEDERRLFGSDSNSFYNADYGVKLANVSVWDRPKDARALAPELDLVENPAHWGVYLQGGIRSLSNQDWLRITDSESPSLADRIREQEDLESESDFALESNLEEFIEQNWDHIDFGRNLRLHTTDEASGRQFPAGQNRWSIDFLARDKDDGSFVVIELKKGKTGDAVVGQLARYMVWVRENLAEEGDEVHGIVIARNPDESLKTAIRINDRMSLMSYHVNFTLAVV